ncbi:hypothetical protein EVG20_g11473, partial [Dentipellis fragilis]
MSGNCTNEDDVLRMSARAGRERVQVEDATKTSRGSRRNTEELDERDESGSNESRLRRRRETGTGSVFERLRLLMWTVCGAVRESDADRLALPAFKSPLDSPFPTSHPILPPLSLRSFTRTSTARPRIFAPAPLARDGTEKDRDPAHNGRCPNAKTFLHGKNSCADLEISLPLRQRKTGLFKKAYELGVLCSVDVAVIIFERRHGHPDKLYQYCSSDIGSMVQRHLRFDGERDTRGPHDFSGNADTSRADDAGDDDDDPDADDMPSTTRPRSGSKAKVKTEGGKMVSVKTSSSAELSALPTTTSTSPTLPVSSDRHTGTATSASRTQLSHWSSSGNPNKRTRLAPAGEDLPSAPSPAFSPYRYDSEPHHSLSHTSYPQLHGQSHQHTPSYHTPYFHGAPPSLAAAPPSGFLHASASFPPGGSSSSHSHAPTLRSAGFSSPVSQMYPPSTHRSTQQPPPRISQPTSQSSQQSHSHPTSPDDIFAGV